MTSILPAGRPFLTAEWRHLVMLNYEIDANLLRPLVPAGTELDDWQGRTLVSVVGFCFLRTRIRSLPVPFHRDFDEVNLRFYVRRWADHAWRRAVVFIREIVPRYAIATVARLVYNEPYMALPMRHAIEMDGALAGAPGRVRYQWKQGRWYTLDAVTAGTPSVPEPGSEAEFITEHYWGYTAQRDGGCLEYQVAHPQWRVWKTSAHRFDCDIDRVYGSAYREALSVPPCSAFVAEGSAVTVYSGVRLAREPMSYPPRRR